LAKIGVLGKSKNRRTAKGFNKLALLLQLLININRIPAR
jgi:hypothetical protein